MGINNSFLYSFYFFIAYLSTINIINVFMYSVTGNSFFINIAPASKDLLFVFIFLILFYFIFKYKRVDSLSTIQYFIILYVLFVLFSVAISDASFKYIILNIRRITEFMLIILVFSMFRLTNNQYTRLLNFSFVILLAVFIFGVIGVLLPIEFWDDFLKVPEYWNNSAFGSNNFSSIFDSGRGYTSDLIFLTGEKFPRMLSTFVEPTTLGSFFTFYFIYSFFKKGLKYRNLYLVVSLIGGILIFSKAFLLSFFMALIFKIIGRPSLKLAFAMMVVIFILSLVISVYLGKVHGGLSHFIGFYSGFELLFSHPFGFGLGEAGNRGQFVDASIMNGNNGGESGLGNVLAQIGVFGGIIIIIFYKLLRLFSNLYNKFGNDDFFALFMVTFTWFVIFCLSASSLGLSGNFIFFIFIGLFLNRKFQQEIFKESSNA